MSDDSKIEWTDATWNPIRGCSRVSAGCQRCYAERVAARFSGPGQPYEGLAVRKLRVVSDDEQTTVGRWTGAVRMVPEHLADPLRWRRPRRVFVNSMSDLFHESLSNEQIAAVFGVMVLAAQHTYQVLTKRAKRMREFFARVSLSDCLEAAAAHRVPGPQRHNWPPHQDWHDIERWPVPWIWLGVSVENQAAADERIPELLRTPAAVRWLSCEPLLGEVDLLSVVARELGRAALDVAGADVRRLGRPALDWLVMGAESGPGARAADPAWFRGLAEQCKASGVPVFFKQGVVGGGITAGPESHAKHGGLVGLPLLDGASLMEFPR